MEKIAKYTTVLYAIIWFFGFIISNSYYSCFNIRIIEYMDFSEVIFIFFSTMMNSQLILKIVLFLFMYVFAFGVLYRTASKSKGISILLLLWFSIVLILVLIINTLLSYFEVRTPVKLSFTLPFFAILFLIKIYGSFGIENNISSSFFSFLHKELFTPLATVLNRVSWGSFILLLAVAFTAITLNSNQESQSLNLKDGNNKSEFNISFVYKENEIKTTSSLIYVGSTNNYIFLYDREKKHSEIYEKVNLHNFEIW